ncbi:hypothetical protein [Chelativorans sp.]|uniref:hypothetical protein n=1 Tax=Chelativorans sp. TaxID=2203393 RepID=UPI002810FD3B|nr:hypothetical protein [Chelativorans sp.]
MINRFEDAICGCCGRVATGFGYAPRTGQTVLWVCDDPECLQIAKDSYTMKQETFSRLESLAAGKGGDEGGSFLDQIGKGDSPLSSLTPDEWFEFCRRIVAGYRKALIAGLKDEAPF